MLSRKYLIPLKELLTSCTCGEGKADVSLKRRPALHHEAYGCPERRPLPQALPGITPSLFSYVCLISTPLLYLETDTEADGEAGRLVVPGGVSPK